MKNLVIDVGNTKAKVGIFEGQSLTLQKFFSHEAELQTFVENSEADNIIVSTVVISADKILSWSDAPGQKIALSTSTLLPVNIAYKTPATLGVDRIAAVCGAIKVFPGQNCLVIDAGTCITFEFVDDQSVYHGGSISPGIKMRLQAMNHFTARLPLVEIATDPALIGDTTETGMQSGAVNGVRAEVMGIVQAYKIKYPDIKVLVCGGDAKTFEKLTNETIFVIPELVLVGLNKILEHVISVGQ